MYRLYSSTLVGLFVLAGSTRCLAQNPVVLQLPKARIDRAALRIVRPVRLKRPAQDATAGRPVLLSTPANAAASLPAQASWGTLIGQTTYDLQTNYSPGNRLAMTGTNLSAVWTQTCQASGGSFANRGIGYNFSFDDGVTFSPVTDSSCLEPFGIATVRTGWPEVAHVNGDEFVVAHTGSGLAATRRALGTGVWSPTATLSFTTSTDGGSAVGTWPRMVGNGAILHLVYCSNGSATVAQQPSGVINPLLYARSTDGGVSWDQQNVVLPGMSAMNFRELGADVYAIGVSGSTVAIAAGGLGENLVLWKSTNDGTTFVPRVIAGNYTDADTVAVHGSNQDTAAVVAPDGSMSVVAGPTGTIHWFGGTQLVQVRRNNATGRWERTGVIFPDVVRELWYWNDAGLVNSPPQSVAGLDPYVGSTAIGAELASGMGQTPLIYNNIGPVSMPTAITDSNGDTYVIFAGGVRGTSNTAAADGQYYRDLYLQRLTFPGNGLVQTYVPKNISRELKNVPPDGAAGNGEESVFPSAVHTVVNNKIHYQWMSDFEPGTALQPANSPDPEIDNAIMHDAIDLSTVNWTPASVLGTHACTLPPPVVSSNSPVCGDTLTLAASNVTAGAAYLWTGPNGFTSTAPTPRIPNATSASAGAYHLTISLDSCSASATHHATVQSLPAPTPQASPATINLGQSTTLSVTNPRPGHSYTWNGPGLPANGIAGSSVSASPTTSGSAQYFVTDSSGIGCQAMASLIVTVVPTIPPRITSFTPDRGEVGTVVTIYGRGFTGTTAVSFGGVAAAFTINSDTTITATVAADSPTGPVTVGAPTGTVTSTARFKVVPAITGFTPASGLPGTVVSIAGTGFTGATSVRFAGVPATSFTIVSSTTITATVPSLAASGRLSVTTPGGTAFSAASFTLAPVITSFTPGSGAVGSVVVVTGRELARGTSVSFNGTPAPTTYNSPTQLTAVVPAGAISGPLSVTNAAGSSTSAAAFTVTAGTAPTITGFSPSTNAITGTLITITGTGFAGAISVTFNDISTTTFTVLSNTQISAAVPAGATTGRLYVTTPAGMAQSRTSLVILQVPTITAFSPDRGPVGTTVTVYGTKFTGATSVRFGSTPATFTLDNSSRITATVPAGAATGPIEITNAAGTGTSSGVFTVTGPRPGPRVITGLPAEPTEVLLYPNPATDWLRVRVMGDGHIGQFIELVDCMGRVARSTRLTGGTTTISLQGLAPGMYVVRSAGQMQRLMVE